eukprot:gnl/TRDRNA2_/TRDRNA2_176538_c0_seq12.p1 gnl/TRDRNA2_/TRDRNA2_176538_c0~~gnl/TRDRNA2_/TRDRNA2_176538_c0_seq12.p1  ORF type:complete len:160 (+),score=63.65 gnl/TRDRNA2_/TRDRNA2_176538_c0_seq12:259-738(+)
MQEYENNPNILVADVDCTTGGKSLCSEVGVRGYPSIKYGDPADMQDYNGGRSLDDLKKHAATLGPTCSPANIDLCDDAKKKQIAEFTALSSADREKKIKESEEAMEKLEKDFSAFVEGLNKQYKEESEKKEKGVKDIKESGLGLLKAVHKHEQKAKGEL